EGTAFSRSGAVTGTPGYMAPEQIDGLDLDGRADLFGLGCVLYRLLTGRRAFPGATLTAVLRATATTEPAPPASVNAAVPGPLSELVMQLLSRERDRRPASARAGAGAPPPPGPGPARPPARPPTGRPPPP